MDAPEITTVCFKQIDGDYWYGWYLDLVIVMNKQTGWVNATKFCDDHNKRFRNWTQNTTNKRFNFSFSESQNRTDRHSERSDLTTSATYKR